ncbi:hypothetical protein [Streptomyces sp. Rer75]|uniref:hypothetical protein n=1 Tax=unclassified Streptomyces TaxID=2593676 RepID=UPI00211E4D01|nr:hypothetical protein [Streptomyces sp. Rer75]
MIQRGDDDVFFPLFPPLSPQAGRRRISRAFELVPLGGYLVNTVIFAGGTTLLETVTAALAAYAFARLRFPGRSVLFGIYLATLMIPTQVTLIPQFILVAKAHGVDTWAGMILPHAFTALGVFLLRQFFLSIPRDYEEAAFPTATPRGRRRSASRCSSPPTAPSGTCC